MLTKNETRFSLFLLVILVIDLICGSIDQLSHFRFISKPAILTILIIFFQLHSGHLRSFNKKSMLMALGFSLLGDILLMFVYKSPTFFVAGLSAFLIAHIMYVLVFIQNRNPERSVFLFLSLLIVYGFVLFFFIKDGLGNMIIPVILYIIAIFSMATTAYIRKGKVSFFSYNLVLVGAMLFMLSDSMIALDKFYASFQFSNIMIMLTYGIAQLLIVLGILRQIE